jgi:hypothetical protein
VGVGVYREERDGHGTIIHVEQGLMVSGAHRLGEPSDEIHRDIDAWLERTRMDLVDRDHGSPSGS